MNLKVRLSIAEDYGRMSQGNDVRQESGDQRAAERSGIELRVEYQRMNTFFYDYTRNISRGGTFIRTSRPLDVGTTFVFKLQVPALAAPLELTGEVRWVRPEGDPAGGEPGMGIQFVFADEAQRTLVDEVVERLMSASLGPLIAGHLRSLPR